MAELLELIQKDQKIKGYIKEINNYLIDHPISDIVDKKLINIFI